MIDPRVVLVAFSVAFGMAVTFATITTVKQLGAVQPVSTSRTI
jgi:hypothetical protein